MSTAGHIQHGGGRINAPDFVGSTQCCSQQPCTAAQIKNAVALLCQTMAIARVVAPTVVGIVELDQFGIVKQAFLQSDRCP